MPGSSPGREILHSVDSAWIYDNIVQLKPKAAPWVKEDVPAIMAQLALAQALARERAEPDHPGDA